MLSEFEVKLAVCKYASASGPRNGMHAVIGVGACMPMSPDSKVRGANIGPIWDRQNPCAPDVGPMNFAIREEYVWHDVSGLWIEKAVFLWIIIAHLATDEFHCFILTMYNV